MVSTSDHLPLVFTISKNPKVERRKNNGFKFDNMWTRRNDCAGIIKKGWNGESSDGTDSLVDRVKRCGVLLQKWGREVVGKVHCNIRRKKEVMSKAYERRDGDVLIECKKELNGLLQDDEVRWRQRSKALWLKEGD